jgi:hypothetical protein
LLPVPGVEMSELTEASYAELALLECFHTSQEMLRQHSSISSDTLTMEEMSVWLTRGSSRLVMSWNPWPTMPC